MKKFILISLLVLAFSGLLVGCNQPAAIAKPASTTDVIFTKWLTTAGTAPIVYNMAGVVSGDAGPGLYAGEVLELSNPTPTTSTGTVLYHIKGSSHQFTARLSVNEDSKGNGVLKGVVTDGWMKGAEVNGNYQTIAPSGIINAQQGAGGDAVYQGTLHIEK